MTRRSAGAGRWGRGLGRIALSLAAGLCASLAWPALDVWPLIFLTPTLLCLAVDGLGGGRRFLVAWLGGSLAYGVTFHWVYVTMRDMSSFPPAAAVGALIAFGLFHGLLWALFAWALGPIRRRLGNAWLFVAAVLWAAMERVFPFVFPIFFGYALWSSHVMIQAADIVGVPGLSFLIFFAGAALADLGLRRRAPAPAPGLRYLAASLVVLVAVYGFARIYQVTEQPVTKRLDIGVVQPNTRIEEKHSSVDRVRYGMLARALEQTEALLAQDPPPELIIWPEGSSPFTQPDLARSRADVERGKGSATAHNLRLRSGRVFAEVARRTKLGLVFGSLRRVGRRTRNAAVHMPADAGLITFYDKMVLVPFGEYVPFSDWFPSLRGAIPGVSDFERGTERPLFHLGEVTALPTICYENIFSGFVHDGLAEGGEMLVNVTNDMWFGDTRALDLHLMAQAIRCVENRVPLVRATGTGVSAFVDATGRVIQSTPRLEATHLRGTVEIRDIASFHRRFGELFFWLLVAAALGFVARAWRRGRRGGGGTLSPARGQNETKRPKGDPPNHG